jgi:hypothetical protein
MQNTIGSHEPALVSPQYFLDRMTHLWSEPPFNMPTSPALLGGWRVMAEHYHALIISNLSDTPVKTSFVLPLPTGAGKTEGTCVYAALQAERNVDHPKPVGVLIVTRLIADADKVAHKVNALAGRKVAVAHHSENKLSESVMATYDVLVITHQTFMNAFCGPRATEVERSAPMEPGYPLADHRRRSSRQRGGPQRGDE